MQDTIFALSSGRMPAGVAVIRVSGPASRFAHETMVGPLGAPREAMLRPIRRPDGEILDRGLAIWFPAPRSFTGEDCLELHLHGSVAVASAVLASLASLQGLRAAEAGEFTRRAFLNGKIDLVQAEALADLIAAETEAQRRFALLNAAGGQSDLYRRWRERLIRSRALLEAELDFADEADVPGSVAESAWHDLGALADEIARHCAAFHRAEIVREGFDVVLLGAPNAGKSSLLNALARRDAAIVSPEAGTTRDLIEVALNLDGYKVRVTDTAGLRDSTSGVECEGVSRALARAARADLVLHLVDMADPGEGMNLEGFKDVLRVGSKADLADPSLGEFAIETSVVDGRGVDTLLGLMAGKAAAASPAADLVPSHWRHVTLLRDAERHVRAALGSAAPLELRAEELRLASVALGRITGEIDVEDLLDSIFSTFCIGK
jgi:tRNA modification GTPase